MEVDKSLTISVVVSYTYPYIGSGIGNVAQKQAELLAQSGHQVFLLSSNFPKSSAEFVHKKVTHIKFPALFFLEKVHVPVPLTMLSPASIKAISRSDIVHIHDGLYLSSFLAAIVAKLFRKKVIVTVHINHLHYQNVLVNTLEYMAEFLIAKPVFMLSDKILVINHTLEKELKSYKVKIQTLSNGVDLKLFHPAKLSQKIILRKKYNIPLQKKIVLFVGRLVPKKGFNLLIEARSNQYEILFVGTGEVSEQIKKLPGLSFVGPKSQEELAEYYQLSDVFVLPSHGEGYPLSVKEALASGLPVITTFTHSSLISMYDTWVHNVEPTATAIKTRIIFVLNRKGSSTEEAVRQAFLKKFDWTLNVLDLTKIYNNVLAKL